jgi:hypothetical protein
LRRGVHGLPKAKPGMQHELGVLRRCPPFGRWCLRTAASLDLQSSAGRGCQGLQANRELNTLGLDPLVVSRLFL